MMAQDNRSDLARLERMERRLQALPLNTPVSVIVMCWQFCKFAPTLPSMTSQSHEVISPDNEVPRPTISFRAAISLPRDPTG